MARAASSLRSISCSFSSSRVSRRSPRARRCIKRLTVLRPTKPRKHRYVSIAADFLVPRSNRTGTFPYRYIRHMLCSLMAASMLGLRRRTSRNARAALHDACNRSAAAAIEHCRDHTRIACLMPFRRTESFSRYNLHRVCFRRTR